MFLTKLKRYWFQPGSPTNLAVCRFLFYSGLLYFFGRSYYLILFNYLPEAAWLPVPALSFFDSRPLDGDTTYVLFYVWVASLVFSALGLLTRIATAVAAILCFFLFACAESYGYYTHIYLPSVVVLLIFPFTYCHHRLSLDALILRWRGKCFFPQPNEYGWPIRLIQFSFVMIFFAAGLSKLQNGGWEWIAGDTLRNYFARSYVVYWDVNHFASQFELYRILAEHPLACKILAFLGVGVELSAPLALTSNPRVRISIISALAVMQIFIYLTILVNFIYYLPIYLFWIPWHRLKASADVQ